MLRSELPELRHLLGIATSVITVLYTVFHEYSPYVLTITLTDPRIEVQPFR